MSASTYVPHAIPPRAPAREVCPDCRSSHLSEGVLVHHYTCGYQAPEEDFLQVDPHTLTCPKCRRELRHYGRDYDTPSHVFLCDICRTPFSEPDVELLCTDCGSRTAGEQAPIRSWYHYELTEAAVAQLQAGRPLQSAEHEASAHTGRLLAGRDFQMLLRHQQSLARRSEQPMTVIQAKARTRTDGTVPANQETVRLLSELFAYASRRYDLVTPLADGFLMALPVCQATAEQIVERLRAMANDTLKEPVDLEVDVLSPEEVETRLGNQP